MRGPWGEVRSFARNVQRTQLAVLIETLVCDKLREELTFANIEQQLFFPEGIAFDGNRFNRTAATAPLFNYLAPSESADEKMVSRLGIEPRTRRLRVALSDSRLAPLH